MWRQRLRRTALVVCAVVLPVLLAWMALLVSTERSAPPPHHRRMPRWPRRSRRTAPTERASARPERPGAYRSHWPTRRTGDEGAPGSTGRDSDVPGPPGDRRDRKVPGATGATRGYRVRLDPGPTDAQVADSVASYCAINACARPTGPHRPDRTCRSDRSTGPTGPTGPTGLRGDALQPDLHHLLTRATSVRRGHCIAA